MKDDIQMNHKNEEVLDDKKDFIVWLKMHKKQLLTIGICVPTFIAIVFGMKNKDTIKELWDSLREEIKKVNKYSSKWFENATDEDLGIEREKVKLAYCSSGYDFDAASRLQNLLLRFDKEMSKRAWGDETPHAPNIPREHGRYLPNDD